MAELKEGMKAPAFVGLDQDGKTVRLSDFAGKKVVLYFYPKDNTLGCIAEACNLRDNYNDLIKKGFAIVGVSGDSEKSHKGFAAKYSLPFSLIADDSKKIINDYGVWKEKSLYGKTYFGIVRTTFIIDAKGNIEKIISKVETSNHTEQIFKLLKQ
ncbi:MAG TPA: thioredoxin-dependent thiol peroxidase [Bacteroidales bacterium]|nr:thioredoxin-dependent thiol peroxidase [Bacteroidales bacterium]